MSPRTIDNIDFSRQLVKAGVKISDVSDRYFTIYRGADRMIGMYKTRVDYPDIDSAAITARLAANSKKSCIFYPEANIMTEAISRAARNSNVNLVPVGMNIDKSIVQRCFL